MGKSASHENNPPEGRSAAILKAALETFAEEGYAAARMEDIAGKAGITKGLIYFYYKNKQELFEAVLEGYIRVPARNAILAAKPSESMACHVIHILAAFYRNLMASGASYVKMLLRILLFEGHRFPGARQAYYRSVMEPVSSLVRDCLMEGTRRGEWKKDAVPRYIQLLFAPCIFVPFWQISMEQYHHLDWEIYAHYHARFLLRSLGLAEDAVEEAMAQAARRQPDVTPGSTPPLPASGRIGVHKKPADPLPVAPGRILLRRSRPRKRQTPAGA